MVSNESVLITVPGIMAQHQVVRGYEVLGSGKVINPENAFIVTNKRILFIVVPLPGAGKLIANVDISMWQWALGKGKIEEKLNELLSSYTLDDILHMNNKNFQINLNDLKKVKIGSFLVSKVTFIKNDDSKYKYDIRDKKKLKDLKTIFASYL
jgi:hypothetical protein